MSWMLAWIATYVLLLAYATVCFMVTIRNMVYQQRWEKEKAVWIRLNPQITRAELCEHYIMFCKRNDCKVDF